MNRSLGQKDDDIQRGILLNAKVGFSTYRGMEQKEKLNLWRHLSRDENTLGMSCLSESSTNAPPLDGSPVSICSEPCVNVIEENLSPAHELAYEKPRIADILGYGKLLKEKKEGPAKSVDTSYVVDIISHVISSTFKSDYTLNLATFKVYICPFQCKVHDRKICPFYHSNKDRRRYPISYKPEQCEYFFDCEDIGIDCPKGSRCEKCHSRHELLYHPLIYKSRFCASYSMSEPCHRQRFCAFAHSRKEICCDLFSANEEQNPTVEFFMYNFKTLWCPYGIQHDWHDCLYAHTYQDCRRSPHLGYVSEPCQQWKKDLHSAEYQSRCPLGARCPRSHGSKEQLYHPSYYKVMPCTDYKSTGYCPRGNLCAFYHEIMERREGITPIGSQNHLDLPMAVFYNCPLPEESMRYLHSMFLKPPLFHLDDFEAFGNLSRRTSKKSMAITAAITDAIRDELGQEYKKCSKSVDADLGTDLYEKPVKTWPCLSDKSPNTAISESSIPNCTRTVPQNCIWKSLSCRSLNEDAVKNSGFLLNRSNQEEQTFWNNLQASISDWGMDTPDILKYECGVGGNFNSRNNFWDYDTSGFRECLNRSKVLWTSSKHGTIQGGTVPTYEHDNKISRTSILPYSDSAL